MTHYWDRGCVSQYLRDAITESVLNKVFRRRIMSGKMATKAQGKHVTAVSHHVAGGYLMGYPWKLTVAHLRHLKEALELQTKGSAEELWQYKLKAI